MARYDFPQALEMQGLLRQFVMNHAGGSADDGALRTVNELCQRLLQAANDSTCRQAIERIEGLASHLFSAEDHRNWDRPGQSGAVHLKQLILRELIGLRLRLRRIEAAETNPQAMATQFVESDRKRPAPSIH
jgi:hypothetical protein